MTGGARRPWLLPGAVIALGLLLVAEAMSLPLLQAYAALGPGFLVLVIGVALTVLGLILAWQVARGVDFSPEEAEGADITAPVSHRGLLIAGAGVFLPVALIGWLGFPISGALAYGCVTRAYGSRSPVKDVAIGLVVASATWFGFTKLGVQLGPYFPPVAG